MPVVLWLLLLFKFLKWFFIKLTRGRPLPAYGKRNSKANEAGNNTFPANPSKPHWVKKEIIRLKALMPQAGCRVIANTFNRRFAKTKHMTVGKTYVNTVIRAHQYDIQVLRQKIKHTKPRYVPRNLVWGMDITGKTDCGTPQPRQPLALCLGKQILADNTRTLVVRHQAIWQTQDH
jgi:putative transposase